MGVNEAQRSERNDKDTKAQIDDFKLISNRRMLCLQDFLTKALNFSAE